MAIRFQLRGGTSAEWSSHNPILMSREIGIETDTNKIKIGNGVDDWNNLDYMTQGERGLKGDTGKGLEFDWQGEQLGIRIAGEGSYTYVNLKGDSGNDLEFNWSGTQLGVRERGQGNYQYVELKGETGSISNLTDSHITAALGYIPLKKSGDELGAYTEKLNTTTGAINLNLGNVFHINASADTTFTITNAKAGSHSFTLYIDMGATVRTLNFPASVKWIDDEIPDMSEPNKTYIIGFSTINSGGKWLGHFGGGY